MLFRSEQKRAALLVGDVRAIWGGKANEAILIETERLLAQAMRDAMPSAAPDVAIRLGGEAQVHEGVLSLMTGGTFTSELTDDPRYRLPDGGYDLLGLLADARAAAPDTLAIDPDGRLSEGDAAFDRQVRLTALGILIGFVFLAGALAQAFRGRRRLLLALGWLLLLAAAVPAIVVGLP